MKNAQIFISMTTALVLMAIDSQAPGNLPEYGWQLRLLVLLLVAANFIVFVFGVRQVYHDE